MDFGIHSTLQNTFFKLEFPHFVYNCSECYVVHLTVYLFANYENTKNNKH